MARKSRKKHRAGRKPGRRKGHKVSKATRAKISRSLKAHHRKHRK